MLTISDVAAIALESCQKKMTAPEFMDALIQAGGAGDEFRISIIPHRLTHTEPEMHDGWKPIYWHDDTRTDKGYIENVEVIYSWRQTVKADEKK